MPTAEETDRLLQLLPAALPVLIKVALPEAFFDEASCRAVSKALPRLNFLGMTAAEAATAAAGRVVFINDS